MHPRTNGDAPPVNAKSDLADRHLSSVVTDFMKMLSADRAEIACKLRKGGLNHCTGFPGSHCQPVPRSLLSTTVGAPNYKGI